MGKFMTADEARVNMHYHRSLRRINEEDATIDFIKEYIVPKIKNAGELDISFVNVPKTEITGCVSVNMLERKLERAGYTVKINKKTVKISF